MSESFDELAREVETYIKDVANVHIGEHIVPAALRAVGVHELVAETERLRAVVTEGKLTDEAKATLKADFRQVVEDFRADIRVMDAEEADALLDAVDALWGWMDVREVKAIEKEDPELAKLAMDVHERRSHG